MSSFSVYYASLPQRKAADVALADVADGDNGGGGLQLLQDFLEAVESGDPSKDEVVSLGELVLFGEGCEENCGIPIDVIVCHFVCRLMSSTSFALASSSVSARHVPCLRLRLLW